MTFAVDLEPATQAVALEPLLREGVPLRVAFDMTESQVISVGADDPRRNRRLSGHESKSPRDPRTEAQRDVDRITYAKEWRRLSAVTQVVTPSIEENPLLHSRLTHSEKVAQVARSIAASLFMTTDHDLLVS